MHLGVASLVGFMFALAAFFGIIAFTVSFAEDRVGLAELALPFSLAVGVMAVYGAFGAARRQWSFAAGVAVGALTLLLFAAVVGYSLAGLYATHQPFGPPWLHLIGTAVSGAVAAGLALRTSIPGAAGGSETPLSLDAGGARGEDEVWLHEVGILLRERGDLSDRRVRDALEDARASISTDPLSDHFGPPEKFASSIPPEPWVAARRAAALYCVIAVFAGWQLFQALAENPAHWSWRTMISAAWFAFVVALAVWYWIRSIRRKAARTRADPDRSI